MERINRLKLWTNFDRPGATFYYIQASHRRNAIETAIGIINDANAQERTESVDLLLKEMLEFHGAWIVETLIQGATLREYHVWEKDTKEYIDSQCFWNAVTAGKKTDSRSHVDKVKSFLDKFAVILPPEIFDSIDKMRLRVNSAKHAAGVSPEDFVSEQEYWGYVATIERYWEELAKHEQFRPDLPPLPVPS